MDSYSSTALSLASCASFLVIDQVSVRALGEKTGETVTSQIWAILSSFMGIYLYRNFPADVDPIIGSWEPARQLLCAAVGWFLYDTINCAGLLGRKHSNAYLFHGVLCFLIYASTLKPMIHECALACLSFELSTVIMNLVHLLDRKYATLRLALKALFALTFFGVRIIFGMRYTLTILPVFWERVDDLGVGAASYLTLMNISVNLLNIYWCVEIYNKAKADTSSAKSGKKGEKKEK